MSEDARWHGPRWEGVPGSAPFVWTKTRIVALFVALYVVCTILGALSGIGSDDYDDYDGFDCYERWMEAIGPRYVEEYDSSFEEWSSSNC